jgi:SAM-dependent methyltransferase
MADQVTGGDPLVAAEKLRAAGFAAELSAAALTQAGLRRAAIPKFGTDAARMFFTRSGLEQATRGEVARRRAGRLAAAGVSTVADLGCGVGADALAFGRAGMRVLAVDADPLTAAVARANAEVLGLPVEVGCADATGVDLSTVDAVFCDPARRRGNTRVFDPAAFSPPWEFVSVLGSQVEHAVLKLAPGIDHGLVPDGVEAEWVSVGGDLVEAAFWYGPLATVPRRSTLLPSGTTLTGPGTREAPVGPPRRYLAEPDPAVIRAHLVAEYASTVDGTLADPTIAYVYADVPVPSPLGRWYEVLDRMPFSVKRLRAALRERDAGALTVKKRGSAIEPDELRRQLRLSGSVPTTVMLTRTAGAPTALIVRAVRA